MAPRFVRDVLVVAGGVICLAAVSPARGQTWLASLQVRSGEAPPVTLRVGQDPQATMGIDAELGEVELPPLSPTGALDVRVIGPDLGSGTRTTILPSSATRVDTLGLWTQPSGEAPIEFYWDTQRWRSGTTLATMQDVFGGDLGVHVDLRQDSTYALTDRRIQRLEIILQVGNDSTEVSVDTVPWAWLKRWLER